MMANGGVIGPVGLNMVALAAKRHAVPFVVVAGCHKVCYYLNKKILSTLNGWKSPLFNQIFTSFESIYFCFCLMMMIFI